MFAIKEASTVFWSATRSDLTSFFGCSSPKNWASPFCFDDFSLAK